MDLYNSPKAKNESLDEFCNEFYDTTAQVY